MRKLYISFFAILSALLTTLSACKYSDMGPTPIVVLPDSATLLFHDNYETGESLQTLGYIGNTRDGAVTVITDSLSVSGTHSMSFPVAGLNIRKKFDENGQSGVSAEWNTRVPASGSFATNLMQNSSSVVRTILFAGNWYYYDENGQRVLMAPYSYNEWMNLRIELDNGFYKTFMNDTLVMDSIPTLNGQTDVNTIYYSLGSKTALVDDIKLDLLEAPVPGSVLVQNETELELAINNASPGDTIIMKDGVWSDIDILFTGNGTETHPITLKAQTPGQVFISGTSSMRIAGEYLVVDGLHFKDGYSSGNLHLIEFRNGSSHANHCRLTNIAITDFNKPDGKDVWVGVFGSYNRIDHSAFQGKVSESVLIIIWRATADANYHQIDHNYFSDIPSIGLGGATAIRIGDGTQALSSSFTTVESNYFENMLGIGKIINIKSGGNTIRANTFVKASGAICIRQGNGNLIEGNYILPGLKDNYTGGILVIGEDHIIRNNYIQGTRRRGKAAIQLYEGEANNHPGKGGYYPTKNVTIEGNTLVDNDKNILIGQYYEPGTELVVPVEGITYKNNAVVGNNDSIPMIKVLDPPIGTITYQGNLFFNGDTTGLSNIPGLAIQDPLLSLGTDSLYHYDPSSPLKSNILAPPLQRSEVGPDWLN